MEKLFKIMKKETKRMVDIIWAESETDALDKYVKRITEYWGHCAYNKNDLYAKKA